MAAFWNGFAKILTNIALWAAEHPQIVQDVVTIASQAADKSPTAK